MNFLKGRCDVAFIDPMHSNKPNTYFLKGTTEVEWKKILYIIFKKV